MFAFELEALFQHRLNRGSKLSVDFRLSSYYSGYSDLSFQTLTATVKQSAQNARISWRHLPPKPTPHVLGVAATPALAFSPQSCCLIKSDSDSQSAIPIEVFHHEEPTVI